jgi:hypothetical protein
MKKLITLSVVFASWLAHAEVKISSFYTTTSLSSETGKCEKFGMFMIVNAKDGTNYGIEETRTTTDWHLLTSSSVTDSPRGKVVCIRAQVSTNSEAFYRVVEMPPK